MSDVDDRLAEILEDWRRRRDEGEWRDPEEVVLEHPELAEELRARFAAMALVDRVFAESAGAPEVPDSIGDYRIVREIGRGGMGVVYEAEQGSMKRRVALKLLFPSIIGSPRAVKRFLREARTAGGRNHTNI
jgi:serine/threonine protein kinase